MKIGIYQEPSGPAIGGSELVTIVAAQALRDRHQVEIVHHREWVTSEKLSDFFHLNLEGINLRYCPLAEGQSWYGRPCSWWRLRDEQRGWNSHLSSPYDLFISSTHGVPPFCHASTGVLYVLFPMFDRRVDWPWNDPVKFNLRGIKNLLRRKFYDQLWRERFSTYRHNLAITRFSAQWAENMWGIHCDVLYPPVLLDFLPSPKADLVVALGRFTPMKQQQEVVAAFRKHVAGTLPDWSLSCLGAIGDSEQDQRYFHGVSDLAKESPAISLQPNADRSLLRETLQRAKIFWHAVGNGVDGQTDPGKLEHFGIATVEAMGAGCVPVVINRGGQREIVQHEESGFLCESPEEMAACTIRLANDERLRERMAEAARRRAQEFSRERFVAGLLSHLGPILQ